MYKMLIINNDPLTIHAIQKTLDWGIYDINTTYEALDGTTAHRVITDKKPDIIIFDLRFPEMTMFELVRKIKETNLMCSVVVISERKDLDYAKNVLSHFIYYAYFVKPITSDGLSKAIEKAIKYLGPERKRIITTVNPEEDLTIIKERIISDLLHSPGMRSEQVLEMIRNYRLPLVQKGRIVYGEIDNIDIYTQPLSLKANADYIFKAIDRQLTDTHTSRFFGYQFNHAFLFLVPEVRDIAIVCDICKKAIKEYDEYFSESISLAISPLYETFDDIRSVYRNLLKDVKKKQFLAINTILVPGDSEPIYKPTIIRALKYISDNFDNNITVKNVTEHLFVSESHLLHIFKEEVGKTFNEYLTDYRLIVAKKLLISGQYRIYEIASMVGYGDTKYFSQVFNKKVGVSPTTFIRLIHPKVELK